MSEGLSKLQRQFLFISFVLPSVTAQWLLCISCEFPFTNLIHSVRLILVVLFCGVRVPGLPTLRDMVTEGLLEMALISNTYNRRKAAEMQQWPELIPLASWPSPSGLPSKKGTQVLQPCINQSLDMDCPGEKDMNLGKGSVLWLGEIPNGRRNLPAFRLH